ncbi:hypothetical protein Btru_071953 [Bulinus truncatus]|nr:hypothetical protein Btru_071953 [Bulinus truncatus]
MELEILLYNPEASKAKTIYELNSSIFFSCSLHAASMTYGLYFRSFVFGVGLLVMAIEMMLRHKDFSYETPFFKTPCQRSLAVSAVLSVCISAALRLVRL